MIKIKVKRVSKNAVSVKAAIKVDCTQRECVEEFAGVLSALRKSSEEIYLLAVMAEAETAREELEHGDKE